MKFRDLKPEEIDVRINTVSAKGLTLLLYKDARVDMDILDETVGAMNWQRCHTRDNANCIVSIWDSEKKQWISKEDTGTESYTEKEKGLASDSFKRACFNWGIGRELYTAPFIFVKASDCNIIDKDNKKTCYDRFIVNKIKIVDKVIKSIEIINLSNSIKLFYGEREVPDKADTSKFTEKPEEEINFRERFTMYCLEKQLNLSDIAAEYGLNKQSTQEDFKNALEKLRG